MSARCRGLGVAVLLAALSGAPAQGESVERERELLRERLDTERAVLSALAEDKTDVLSALDTIERSALLSAQRAELLEAQARGLTAAMGTVQRWGELAQRSLDELYVRARPRLFTLYRLGRAERLAALFSARDFAELVRRGRAMRQLVEGELSLLSDVALVASFEEVMARRLGVLRAQLERRSQAMRTEAALAGVRREKLAELMELIKAEASRSQRLVKELEHSERQLDSMVAEMRAVIPSSGFRSYRGQLPYPTRGVVEMGFGRVVNPKFNTVTVQKGLDIRAPMGAPVVAVAEGTVVFAGWLKGYGNLVIVEHGGGYHSLMAHLSSLQVEVGNQVERGEEIGAVGDTGSLKGAYLYFEIRDRGQAVDPLPWLDPDALD